VHKPTRLLSCCLLIGLLTVPAVAGAADRSILALFDMEDRGSGLSPETLENLTEYLSALMTEGGFQVIPREQLRERLQEQKKTSYKDCFDQSCQIELGRELAAQKTLATKVLKIADECRVTGTLFDLRKAATENAATEKAACTEKDLLRAIEAVVAKLIGEKVSPPVPVVKPPDSSSAEASSSAKASEDRSEDRPEPVAVAAQSASPPAWTLKEYGWNIGLKVGLMAPTLANDSGIKLTDANLVETGWGSMIESIGDFKPIRWFSVGLFGLFIHNEGKQDGFNGEVKTALNFLSVGVRLYARFVIMDVMELRAGVSGGVGIFGGEAKFDTLSAAGAIDLSGSVGFVTGISLEYVWYFHEHFGLLADLGFWTQAAGKVAQEGVESDLTFPPLLYLALGMEWGT
jgi:hypothetical protein